MRKRSLKIIVGTFLVLAVITFVMRDSRLVAQWRFAGGAHIPSVNENFSTLPKVIPAQSIPLSLLLRGLPHPFTDEKEYVRELWNSPNVSVHGYRFYKEPVAVSPEFREVLTAILPNAAAFTPYTGPKLCNGYHADFAAQFQKSGRTHWVLVCFGCGEVLMYSDRDALICELRPSAYKALYKAWKKSVADAEQDGETTEPAAQR